MFLLDENYAINLNYLEEVFRYYDDDDDDTPYSLRLTVNGQRYYHGYDNKEERDKIFDMLVSGNKEGIVKEIVSEI
jgi:hypothetical protein